MTTSMRMTSMCALCNYLLTEEILSPLYSIAKHSNGESSISTSVNKLSGVISVISSSSSVSVSV